MSQVGIVYTTVATHVQAVELAEAAVHTGLAACVNIAPIDSVYRWKGQIEKAEEYNLRFKTAADSIQALVTWMQAHHPYEVPAVWWERVSASEAYADYVERELE